MFDTILTVVISAIGGAVLTVLLLVMRSSGLLATWSPPPHAPQLFPSEPMDELREETLLIQAAERHDQLVQCVQENEALKAQLATIEQDYRQTILNCESERNAVIDRAEQALQHLRAALQALQLRTLDRQARGVENTYRK